MYSLRYGTLPIVRRTGGLADTVWQYGEADGGGNGFLFDDLTPNALRQTHCTTLSAGQFPPGMIDRITSTECGKRRWRAALAGINRQPSTRNSTRQRLRNANVFIICIDVKELIESYYKDKIKPENPDYRVHGWESEAAARKRFGALFAAVDLNGKTLLDVGCGVGSLYDR